MKTYTNLYPEVCTFSALYRAYQLCRKGKHESKYAIEFEQNREENLLALRDELKEERWRPGAYTEFFVEDRNGGGSTPLCSETEPSITPSLTTFSLISGPDVPMTVRLH